MPGIKSVSPRILPLMTPAVLFAVFALPACDPQANETTTPEEAPTQVDEVAEEAEIQADEAEADEAVVPSAKPATIHATVTSEWIEFVHPSSWQVSVEQESRFTRVYGTIDADAEAFFILQVTHGKSDIDLATWSKLLHSKCRRRFGLEVKFRPEEPTSRTRQLFGSSRKGEVRRAHLADIAGQRGFRIETQLANLRDRSVVVYTHVPEFADIALELAIDDWLASFVVPPRSKK